MTNLETLKNAKTKEEYAEILFKYGCEVIARRGDVSAHEWLDKESNSVKATIEKSIITDMLYGGADDE